MKKDKLWVLSFSGAATRIIALVVHAIRLQIVKYKADVMTGVSSGWIVVLCIALEKLSILQAFALALRLDQIFGFVPVKEDGNFRKLALIRLMIKGSAGDSKGIEKSIRAFITEQEWEKFKATSSTRLFAGVTNYTRNNFKLVEASKLNYEDMIQISVASATIPIYCDPIKIDNDLYVDGGVYEHNPADYLVSKLYKEGCTIEKLVSVYSRPKEKSIIPDWGYNGKSAGRNLSKLTESMMDSISRKNEEAERRLALIYGFELYIYYSPSILKGVYDVNPQGLIELERETKWLNPVISYRIITKK